MPDWAWWGVGGAGWVLAAALTALFLGAMVRLRDHNAPRPDGQEED